MHGRFGSRFKMAVIRRESQVTRHLAIPQRGLILRSSVIEILGQRPTGNNDINAVAKIALNGLEKRAASRNRGMARPVIAVLANRPNWAGMPGIEGKQRRR